MKLTPPELCKYSITKYYYISICEEVKLLNIEVLEASFEWTEM